MKKLFVLICFLNACGPQFANPVIAPEASLATVELRPNAKSEGRFYLKNFEDIRKDINLTIYDGEAYKTDSDLTLVVREALSRILVKSGYRSSKDSAIFVNGKLIDWKADVKKGYPDTLLCSAKVYLELLDPTDRRVYSGTYSGQAELQAPGMDNNDLRRALSMGMEKALEQVVKDKGFISVLSSY